MGLNLFTGELLIGVGSGNMSTAVYDPANITEQVVGAVSNQTVGGVKTFTSFPITPSLEPAADYQVANKKYVDDNAGSGGPVTALGTSGSQTINRITSGRWTLTPSAAVTLVLEDFEVNQFAILTITDASTNVTFPASVNWDLTNSTTPPEFLNTGEDLIRITKINSTEYIAERVGMNGLFATSYANSGGTGDRTSIITFTSSKVPTVGALNDGIDGVTTPASGFTFSDTNRVGADFTFDFGSPKVIDEFKWYHEVFAGRTDGVYSWQGSNDDISYDDIKTNILFDTEPASPLIETVTNATPYRYYRLFGTTNAITNSIKTDEFEFKIS